MGMLTRQASPLLARSQRSSQPQPQRKRLRHTLPEQNVLLGWPLPANHEIVSASLERLAARNASRSA